jgi:hypothetical protein
VTHEWRQAIVAGLCLTALGYIALVLLLAAGS